jgi:glycosyltransferase involved in cell wall biosynthesis
MVVIYIPDKGLNVFTRSLLGLLRDFFRGKARLRAKLDYSELLRFSDTPKVRIRRIDFGVASLSRACESDQIQVLLPSTIALPKGFDVPWLGYIYDAQHKYLPHYFSEKDRSSRDKAFMRMLKVAPHVIVNAQAVKSDLISFYGAPDDRISALPFAPIIPRHHLLGGYKENARKYFLVCNQFWVHKNHKIVFHALAKLVRVVPDAHVICTGSEYEPRFPQHVRELKSYIVEQRLTSAVTLMGLVPKKIQLELLVNARALIQPTLFEGGPAGGAGQEAIALGVNLILSDIPVNREVDHTSSIQYFRPNSADDLALLMEKSWATQSRRPDLESLNELQSMYRSRLGAELLKAARGVAV